jgi:hypothetical protein
MEAPVKRAIDSAAHFLYCPGMLGRRLAIARWYHRVHLIPGWLLKLVCDRFEHSVWAEFDTPEDETDAMMADATEAFYEEDEPVEKVIAAFNTGEKGVTAKPVGWKCQHLTMTATLPGILPSPPIVSWCDCEMQPVYATTGGRS